MDEVDVLVIGMGPAGATLALALARDGISVRSVTRYGWLSNTPRAHITNQRAVEVFRDLGIDERLAAIASPWELMGDTLFTTSFAGPEIARIRAWGTGDDQHGAYVRASPAPMLDIPQPELEAVIVRAAAERGAQLDFHTEYLSHLQDDDGVTTMFRDRRTGREYTVRSKFLVGADGARSKVAEDARLPIEGTMGRAATVYAQFSADLSRYVAHRPSILYWIWAPGTSHGEIGMGLLRAVHPWDQWIAGWGYDPSVEPDLSPEAVLARIRTFVGDPELQVELGPISTWQVNEAYATSYGNGRVYCAGDAVHRHPPSGGLGSNTSVQDAFNLAWKLAFVIRGWAGIDLLETYTAERAPVGRAIVERANRSRAEFGALGDAVRGYGSGEALVGEISAPTEKGAGIRDSINRAIEMKHSEFNAHGFELNHVYSSSAVINPILPEGEEQDILIASRALSPGRKLPHAWLVDETGRRISSLDLVGKGKFTLLTGLAGVFWVEAAATLNMDGLRVIVIGDLTGRDLYGEWGRISSLEERQAVLVRPDGYVAWVSERYDDAVALLHEAVTRVLSIEGGQP
ncbi:FAD-dependent monooxygenase [Arthrobacter sp. GAS37]|uniref:FAD-dependent monooxygenase n=1 Tax=Arthrobacter sp. GAS37 TaxID=3156261 RepID=UPI00384E247B